MAQVAVATLVATGLPTAASGVAAATTGNPDAAAVATTYARSRPGRVGFVLRDTQGHVLASLRPHRTVWSASVIKSLFVVAYARMARDRNFEPWERRLLRPMITRSDDAAAGTVRDLLGTQRVTALGRHADLRDFRYHPRGWGRSRISPADMSTLFLRLPELIPPRHRAWVMRLFRSITPRQRWGIPPALPPGFRWYVKGGWLDGVVNQAGLLESGGRRFALAVLISGTPDTETLVQHHPGHASGTRTITGVTRRLLAGIR
ncbi:MAG: serine hydrolase [Candidatus Nanopelagicales bacterium]